MSDSEHASIEELEAAREMELDGAEEEEEQAAADGEDQEEEEAKRDDSDANSEKSDEAIEDNEEPEVDGDSREPSDGESIDGSESDTEHEKRIGKAAALRFLDLEADEGTEKKILKHLKKKMEDDDEDNAYEKDSIMDDEGVITYDTDYENERKARKSKAPKAEQKKKKRKRIATPPTSEDEEAAAESDNHDEEEKEQIQDVSDDELQHMKTLAGTNKDKKVNGAAAPRGKAAFHQHSDIAKAAAEKKNKKISPESLVDSPKLKPTAAPKKTAAAAAAKDGTKKPAAKKPRKSKADLYKLGEIFEMKEKGKSQAYRITYRGEDTPMAAGPTSTKHEPLPNLFHPKYFCTAEKLGETDTGVWDELGVFELFFMNPSHGAPKKVKSQWVTAGWNTFNSQSDNERYQYVIDALNSNNIVKGTDADGNPTKRKMFTDELLQQIKSEAVLNPDGEWSWMPKHMAQADFITPRNEDGAPAVSVKTTASPSNKKPVQPKPKIDRQKETSSHDVKAMLSKTTSTPKKTAATAAAASSSSAPAAKSTPKKPVAENFSDMFGESPEPPQMQEIAGVYGDSMALLNAKELLAEFIETTFTRMTRNVKKAAAAERILEFFKSVDETLKCMKEIDGELTLKQRCEAIDKEIDEKLPKQIPKGFYRLIIMLPLFSAEAAQMMREKLDSLENM